MHDLCIWLMTLTPNNVPVLDRTGYLKSLDVNIEGDSSDINEIGKQLTRFGLALTFSKEDLDCLIINSGSVTVE